jgi:hypothetical protein
MNLLNGPIYDPAKDLQATLNFISVKFQISSRDEIVTHCAN